MLFVSERTYIVWDILYNPDESDELKPYMMNFPCVAIIIYF